MKTKLRNQKGLGSKGLALSESKGFTIIEVLIVLAIAGLIMLIVFLAVPALQRNQRNTGRKSDVGRIGAAVSEFVANNNGRLPVAADAPTIDKQVGSLSQYKSLPATYTFGSNALPANTSLTTVTIVDTAKCDPAVAGATSAAGATARSVAIQYAVENSSGTGIGVCQDI